MACLWLANHVSKLGKTQYLMSLGIDKLYWVATNLRMKSHSAHCPLLRKALILLSSGLIQTSEQLIQIGHMWFHFIAGNENTRFWRLVVGWGSKLRWAASRLAHTSPTLHALEDTNTEMTGPWAGNTADGSCWYQGSKVSDITISWREWQGWAYSCCNRWGRWAGGVADCESPPWMW